MKPSIPTIFLLLLILLSSTQAQYHPNDRCLELNPPFLYPMADSFKTLSSASPLTVNSTDCVTVFQIDLSDPLYQNQYILFEFRFSNDASDPKFEPLLMGLEGAPPGLGKKTKMKDFVKTPKLKVDVSGFEGAKTYHYIELLPSDTNHGGIYYLALYKRFSETKYYYAPPFSYTVTTRVSSSYMCPQECSGPSQGTCDIVNMKCNCMTGFFDVDCSIKPTLMTYPGREVLTVPPNRFVYFYTPMQIYTTNVWYNFDASSRKVQGYYQFSLPESNILPSANFSSKAMFYKYSNTYHDYKKSFGHNENFIVGFYNGDYSKFHSVEVKSIDKPFPGWAIVLLIVLPIIILPVLLGFLIGYIVEKKRRRQQNGAQNGLPPAPAMIPTVPTSNDSYLSLEEIEQFFPKKQYSQLENPFNSPCIVCIYEFKPDSECRKLYCGHIFHSNCIDSWLQKHDKCPQCYALMTSADIKAFIEANPSYNNGHKNENEAAVDMDGRQV